MAVDGQEDDDALVARTATGDAEAFACLVDRHGGRVAALARRMLGPQGEIDDVVQDAMLRLWRQAPAWRPGGAKLSTWLYRVASNLCIDRLRKPSQKGLDDIADPPDPGRLADQIVIASAAAAEVERALQELAPRQRLAIVLCHYEGLGNIEAADTMAVSVEALESLLSRGRRTLKALLWENRQSLMSALSDSGSAVVSEVGDG